MKLFYYPGACSLSAHIALREAGLPFELVKVDLRTKKTEDNQNYLELNPKGYVPAIRLDNGELLTECGALLQFIADQNPASKLAPPYGSFERYRLQEWINYIATEFHKTCGALFNPELDDSQRSVIKTTISSRLEFLSKSLQGKDYLLGSSYSVADAYLFTILGWAKFLSLDLSPWPALLGYIERISARPAVRDALQAEGLLK